MHLLQNQQESMHLNLKYQYEIDHTHIYRWVRVVKDVSSSRAHGATNRESSLQRRPEEDELLDKDKLLIALYIALGCI